MSSNIFRVDCSNKYKVILRILREMAIENCGGPGLNYWEFKQRLEREGFSGQQNGFLKLRLDLLESFMEVPPKPGSETFTNGIPKFEDNKAGRRARDEWFRQRKNR